VDLDRVFGPIDIYLFDQLLKGRIRPGDRVFDAGCGFGRNLRFLLREGYDVFGVDADHEAIASVRDMAASLAPALPPGNFRVEPIEQTSFADGCASVAIASAVLHFARDDAQFDAMVREIWRLLAPGGMLFCRLASTIGLGDRVVPVAAGSRRFRLPDGTERYLVDERILLDRTSAMGGQLLEPLKTTLVQDQRSMTTWVVRKNRPS
jgi:tellurite methyltransferase